MTVFVTALQQAVQHCNFNDLKTELQDQLVCGLQDEKLQHWLFAKKFMFKEETPDQLTREVQQSWSPTLAKKVELAQHENTECDSKVEDEVHWTQAV